jgi:hypothetical protein
MNAPALCFPALRRVQQKEKGAHRSAPQGDFHTMFSIAKAASPQPELHFINEGFQTFSPSQAALVMRECQFERQRQMSKPHVLTLAEYMRRGQWLEKSQIDFARLPNGKLVLVNGHHRMQAQIDAGASVLWSIVVHPCATEADVRGLYYRFDTNVRKRSASSILAGIAFAEDEGLSKTAAAALWEAVPTIADGLRFKRYAQAQRSILTDERVALCREYAAEARFMDAAIKTAPAFLRGKLFSASVFAVALVTLKFCPAQARAFWAGLCEDNGLTKGDPRKTLLLDMQSRSGATGLLASGMMATARAWSAYQQGRDLKHLKVTGHDTPVAGTPFTVRA